MSKKHETAAPVVDDESSFVSLFNGAELPAAVRHREKLFEASWQPIHARIQVPYPVSHPSPDYPLTGPASVFSEKPTRRP